MTTQPDSQRFAASSEHHPGDVAFACRQATPPPSSSTAVPARPANQAAASAAILASVRVLIVEDGPDNQRLLRHFLERAGASVTIAVDGQEAVDLLLGEAASESYQIILMDMQMPRMDGYQATQKLRAGGVRTPIIAVTAHAMPDDRAKCLQSGCDDYQTKPINRAALLASCSHWLSRAATACTAAA